MVWRRVRLCPGLSGLGKERPSVYKRVSGSAFSFAVAEANAADAIAGSTQT